MTYTEILDILGIKFPTLNITGDYNSTTKRIQVECSVCGYVFDLELASIPKKRRNACLNCMRIAKRITKERFEERLAEINPSITLYSAYISYQDKITLKCLVDGYEWETTPSAALNLEAKCPKCVTQSQLFPAEVLDVINNLGYSIRSLTNDVITKHTTTDFVCDNCGHIWQDKLYSMEKRTYGCPACNKIDRKIGYSKRHGGMYVPHDTEEYLEALKSCGSSLMPQVEYTSIGTAILHKCILHDIDYKCAPIKALTGSGCRQCRIDRSVNMSRKHNDEYVAELSIVNPYVTPIEEYKSMHYKILHRCLKCGNEWKVDPGNMLSGHGCPCCWRSKGESLIHDYLKNNNVSFEEEYAFENCRNILPLRYDFYISSSNTVIEFQGQQHYFPVNFGGVSKEVSEKQFLLAQERDQIKQKYCKDNGIRLIEIPYWDSGRIDSILDDALKFIS